MKSTKVFGMAWSEPWSIGKRTCPSPLWRSMVHERKPWISPNHSSIWASQSWFGSRKNKSLACSPSWTHYRKRSGCVWSSPTYWSALFYSLSVDSRPTNGISNTNRIFNHETSSPCTTPSSSLSPLSCIKESISCHDRFPVRSNAISRKKLSPFPYSRSSGHECLVVFQFDSCLLLYCQSGGFSHCGEIGDTDWNSGRSRQTNRHPVWNVERRFHDGILQQIDLDHIQAHVEFHATAQRWRLRLVESRGHRKGSPIEREICLSSGIDHERIRQRATPSRYDAHRREYRYRRLRDRHCEGWSSVKSCVVGLGSIDRAMFNSMTGRTTTRTRERERERTREWITIRIDVCWSLGIYIYAVARYRRGLSTEMISSWMILSTRTKEKVWYRGLNEREKETKKDEKECWLWRLVACNSHTVGFWLTWSDQYCRLGINWDKSEWTSVGAKDSKQSTALNLNLSHLAGMLYVLIFGLGSAMVIAFLGFLLKSKLDSACLKQHVRIIMKRKSVQCFSLFLFTQTLFCDTDYQGKGKESVAGCQRRKWNNTRNWHGRMKIHKYKWIGLIGDTIHLSYEDLLFSVWRYEF